MQHSKHVLQHNLKQRTFRDDPELPLTSVLHASMEEMSARTKLFLSQRLTRNTSTSHRMFRLHILVKECSIFRAPILARFSVFMRISYKVSEVVLLWWSKGGQVVEEKHKSAVLRHNWRRWPRWANCYPVVKRFLVVVGTTSGHCYFSFSTSFALVCVSCIELREFNF